MLRLLLLCFCLFVCLRRHAIIIALTSRLYNKTIEMNRIFIPLALKNQRMNRNHLLDVCFFIFLLLKQTVNIINTETVESRSTKMMCCCCGVGGGGWGGGGRGGKG